MPRTGGPSLCPLPPAPAPHTPPFLGSASGPSHGCPPTLQQPPGAPVGDPTAALHLPPSPAAPVGDPTVAIHPPPHSQAAPVGDPTAALPPPLFPCSAGGRSHGCAPPPPTTGPITPPAEWSSGQPHELLGGSRGFESLPSPRAPDTGNTVYVAVLHVTVFCLLVLPTCLQVQ